jgi:hypothetical protein
MTPSQTEGEALTEREALAELVAALDATNWSSWQTTARFWPALEAARAALSAVALPAPPPTGWWRCFHCDLSFTDPDAAEAHFGRSEMQEPSCQIDAAKYREMEERVRSCNDEDSDLHRRMYRMESDHQQALRSEEEAGYAKGLRDGRALASPAASPPPPAAERTTEQVIDDFYRTGQAAPTEPTDFERGRQQGAKQERALWELAASSQETSVHPAAPSATVEQRLAARILVKHGGLGDPWRDHWNLTENDSLLHKDALAALHAKPEGQPAPDGRGASGQDEKEDRGEPAVLPSEPADAMDAKRYRWLRDVAWANGMADVLCVRYGPEEWDEYIDATLAILAAAPGAVQTPSPTDPRGNWGQGPGINGSQGGDG